jgi:cytochrome P450
MTRRTARSGGLPPGPRLPALVQTLLWAADPVGFATRCAARHGPLFTARILGFGPVVHVCTPDGVRRVLRDEAADFDAAAANRAIDFVVGEHSLLMAEDATHTARRRLLVRPLHGENVAAYVAVMEAVVEQEVRTWPVGTTVRLLDGFQRVTLEVMVRAVFGITDSRRLERLRVLVPRLLDLNPLIILVPAARRRFGGFGPWARFRRLVDEVDAIIHAEIRERRAASGPGGPAGPDVLSVLLAAAEHDGTALSDAELRDHLVTLLAVGQETTASQLAWFFERVLRHPDALARVRAAVDGGDQRVLDAAIHEAVRVRPTTMDLGRVNRVPWEADGHVVPPGTLFAVSLGLLHRSGALHPEPEHYSLDRFVPVEPPSGHFLPFGGGRHRCIGASLAMVEMRTVIAAVLRGADFALPHPEDERIAPKGPMLVPGRGAEVRVTANRVLDAVAADAPASDTARATPAGRE